jgi:hypothetical protein
MPFLAEAFVMDNQGANVAMTDKTSDYWQGDEPGRSRSRAGRALSMSAMSSSDSTQTYTVQVSVPVMDGGKAIGAINVDQVQ